MRQAISVLRTLGIGCGWALALLGPAGATAVGLDAVLEAPSDRHPGSSFTLSVEFDGQGGALMVWNAGCNSVSTARSDDNGITWRPARLLFEADTFSNYAFDLAHGGGTWIVVWSSTATLGGTLAPNLKILAARSADGGATWSAVVPLSTPDLPKSEFPSIATDGQGRWIVAWRAGERMLHVRSSDDGLSWTLPKLLGPSGTTIEFEIEVDLATDRAGTWIAVWPQYMGGPLLQWDVGWTRSTDAGVTWSAPGLVGAGTEHNEHPAIAAGGAGQWLVVWDTRDADASWNDIDVVASHSGDDGLSWGPAVPVNTNYDSDGILDDDERPEIATDGRGNWIVAWQLRPPGAAKIKVLGARSSDSGASWSPGAKLHTGSVPGDNLWQELVTDRRGTWLLSWSTTDYLTPTHTFIVPFRLHFALTCASDQDGDGYGSAGEPICPFGTTPDCDDDNVRVAPGAADLCDGASNECAAGGWPALAGTNDLDDDGDGLSECALDCDDALPEVWSAPGAAVLALARDPLGAAILSWAHPEPGGIPGSARFDTFRNTSPKASACATGWTCLEGDAADASTEDADVPAAGQAFFYVVSPQNACSAEIPAQLACP